MGLRFIVVYTVGVDVSVGVDLHERLVINCIWGQIGLQCLVRGCLPVVQSFGVNSFENRHRLEGARRSKLSVK